jgi:hypothetical protein
MMPVRVQGYIKVEKNRTLIAADWPQIAADQDKICVNLPHLRAGQTTLTQPWSECGCVSAVCYNMLRSLRDMNWVSKHS